MVLASTGVKDTNLTGNILFWYKSYSYSYFLYSLPILYRCTKCMHMARKVCFLAFRI
jgi:hypothetical protein